MAKKVKDLYVFDFDKSRIHKFKTTKDNITMEDVKTLGYGMSNNIQFMASNVEVVSHSGIVL